jgi:serine/threonine protein kinase
VHLESFYAVLAFIHGGYGTIGATFDDWRPIVHRGIKLENILAMTNRITYPSFKLGDFGISRQYRLFM